MSSFGSSAICWSGRAARSSPSLPPSPQQSPPTSLWSPRGPFLFQAIAPPSPQRSPPTSLWSPRGSTKMDEIDPFLQTSIVCCGGKYADQDVSISLVLPRLPQEETHYSPLAEVRVHSSRLRSCSKYYATALGPPCPKRKRTPLACKLEVYADETVYCDCFRRMYTPFRKNFGDVSYALQLLRVAIQIEFEELSRAICSYLSLVPWSGEEELKIRRYVPSLDFPRGQAEELVARLERKRDPCKSTSDSAVYAFSAQSCRQHAAPSSSTVEADIEVADSVVEEANPSVGPVLDHLQLDSDQLDFNWTSDDVTNDQGHSSLHYGTCSCRTVESSSPKENRKIPSDPFEEAHLKLMLEIAMAMPIVPPQCVQDAVWDDDADWEEPALWSWS